MRTSQPRKKEKKKKLRQKYSCGNSDEQCSLIEFDGHRHDEKQLLPRESFHLGLVRIFLAVYHLKGSC